MRGLVGLVGVGLVHGVGEGFEGEGDYFFEVDLAEEKGGGFDEECAEEGVFVGGFFGCGVNGGRRGFGGCGEWGWGGGSGSGGDEESEGGGDAEGGGDISADEARGGGFADDGAFGAEVGEVEGVDLCITLLAEGGEVVGEAHGRVSDLVFWGEAFFVSFLLAMSAMRRARAI